MESFSQICWSSVEKTCINVAYSPKALLLYSKEIDTKDLSVNDDISLHNHFNEHKILFEAMLTAYDVAKEHAPDPVSKNLIAELKQGFTRIRPTEAFMSRRVDDSFALTDFQSYTRGLANFIKTKVISANDQETAACALVPLVVYMKLHLHLTNLFPTGWMSSILETCSVEYPLLLGQTERLLDQLCLNTDIEIVRDRYKNAMQHILSFYHEKSSEYEMVPVFKYWFEVSFGIFDGNKQLISSPFLRDYLHTTVMVEKKLRLCTTALAFFHLNAIDNLSEISLLIAPFLGQNAPLKRDWDRLLEDNVENLSKCMIKILNTNKRTGLDFPGLLEGMKHYQQFADRMSGRGHDMLLTHLELDKIKLAMKNLIPCEGCEGFLKAATWLQLPIFLSAHSSLKDLLDSTFSEWDLPSGVPPTIFWFDESDSVKAKYEDFNEILKGSSDTIFVGQSVADLPWLLEANIGILLGSDESVIRVGNYFGVKFIPLFHWVIGEGREDCLDVFGARSGRVFTVESWSEIHAFVLGNTGALG